MAAPIPDAPPVTMAVFPSNRALIGLLLFTSWVRASADKLAYHGPERPPRPFLLPLNLAPPVYDEPAPGPPARIETARLVIRCWVPEDAVQLRDAIDGSLVHLREWMPWAADEPRPLDETRGRLAVYAERFRAGEDFTYGIFTGDEVEVVGGCGLHPRIGPGGLEIGYWIRRSRLGRGLATEMARALTDAAFDVPGVERVQIHCDPENRRSANIPRKLGFPLVEHRVADGVDPAGELRDTLVFEVRREEW
jgi:RimJ/RimL family protein N-acetyltransferase